MASTLTQDLNLNNKVNRLKSGFSFIELIVAISIMAILAIVIVPGAMKWLGRAKETRTEQTLNTLRVALDDYHLDNGKYPNKLEDLIKKPADAKKWRGDYLTGISQIPDDGWGNPFIYKPTPKGAHKYELYAESPEGVKYSVWK